jgi:hypothetical protein
MNNSLKKLTLLSSLLLLGFVFSNGVNATCVKTGTGAIDITTGTSPVQDTTESGAVDACNDTPDEYKVVLYKLGLCTSDSSYNDLSSCQYIINDATGLEQVITYPNSTSPSIPEFSIDPATYPYMVVVLGAKLGIKHSFTTDENIDGSGSTDGKYCWTANSGFTTFTSEGDTVTGYGTSESEGTQMLDCGTSPGTAVFTYEVINKLNGDSCSATWVANGDRWPVSFDGGTTLETVGNGTAVINLLQQDDSFATGCSNVYKILWTTNLTTPIVVTENSTYDLKVRTKDSVSLDFSDSSNNRIIKAGADPVQIYLTVTQ